MVDGETRLIITQRGDMNLIFCGTPQFAVPTLEAVLRAGHDVELVVTQPDRPSGRGMQLVASSRKAAALTHNLPVIQPEKIKNNQEFREQLETNQPRRDHRCCLWPHHSTLDARSSSLGNINLHASLLPQYRGAAPIQWAVATGETVTGATTMRIDDGLDTGDMLLQDESAHHRRSDVGRSFPAAGRGGRATHGGDALAA